MTVSLFRYSRLSGLLIILSCLGSAFKVLGQEPAYWQLTDEEGLPSMTVYETLQDSRGFIWMGTENGVCKYDGQSFTTFPNKVLKDNEVLKIRKDARDRIWFITLTEQLAYIENEQVIPFFRDSILQGKKIVNLQIGESVIWLFYYESKSQKRGILNYYLYKEEQPVFNKQFPSSPIPRNPMKTQSDTLSLIKTYTDTSITLQHFTANKIFTKKILDKKVLKEMAIYGAFSHFQGYIIILAKSGNQYSKIIAVADDHLLELASFNTLERIINIKIIDNTCWVLSNSGIWNFPLNPMLKPSVPVKILPYVNANDIFKDREGNFWISTTSQGLKIIPLSGMQSLNTSNGNLPSNEVFNLYYDSSQDRIISGHSDGKIAIHQSQQVIKVLDLEIKGRVLDISQNQQKRFYIAVDAGFTVLDQHLNFLSTNLRGGGIKTIIEDSQQQTWFGAAGNVTLVKNINFPRDKYQTILEKRTYALQEDVYQRIWIGTTEGLYYFQDSLSPYLENKIHEKYYVTSMTETPDSTLWVSTKSNGILAIKNNQTIHRYTTKEGLASNQCKRIFWDDTHLWIASNKGLNYLDPKTGAIGWINKKDGLPSNEVYDVLVAKNEVWVASPKGIAHFPKDIKHLNQTPPLVYLSSLKIWEKEYPLDMIVYLKHHQNSLQFNFIGLGFKAKNAITYKYKMSGLDQDWIYTNTPSVRYPAINPGDYQFKVYAINEDGLESAQAAQISVSIAVAWWQQWWLRLIALLLLLGVVYLFLQNRFRKREEERKTQDKINQLKQQALQAQMNPHFIFNVLGAIQNSLTVNKQEQAMLYLSNFSKLIRSIFNYSKRKEITLEEEIDFLNRYLELEKLRFRNKITVDFTIEPELEEYLYFTKIPPLMLQPLVENAFKHGLFHKEENGRLSIRFSKEKKYVRFTIEDNGIGREKSKSINKKNWHYQSHQSSGIQTIEDRLKIINQKNTTSNIPAFKIEDLYHQKEAIGTRITVSIYCQHFN